MVLTSLVKENGTILLAELLPDDDPGSDTPQHTIMKEEMVRKTQTLRQENRWSFSSLWKRAKGEDKDPTLPRSYRSLCLLNVLGKIQEKILAKRLRDHRAIHDLHLNQYGFRQGR